ncbi:hypothetical protein TNCT_173621 [Trichonephila clavata]|uniref:Uncharacterized protein n=1 Tax=Trichonephila clavata TaxID=2740835 RepID=A0A8X6LZJ3_TRICU|nr:hypothetical protein TNCT_173621 [Trichonephila clavata]
MRLEIFYSIYMQNSLLEPKFHFPSFSKRYHAERQVPKIGLKDFRILEKIRLNGAKLKGTQVKRRQRSDAQKQNDIRRERERKQLSEEYTKGIYYSKEMGLWNSKSHALRNGGNLE